MNHILVRENSAYRFIDSTLAPISNDAEVKEIESALSNGEKFFTVRAHIETALSLMADRSKPDYRNSIKESISAVEAAAKLVTNNRKATLGDALKLLESETKLHGALRDGFSKLYGWTSDADGIRHAMMETSNLTVSDARFMLIACSAFANYLIDRTSVE